MFRTLTTPLLAAHIWAHALQRPPLCSPTTKEQKVKTFHKDQIQEAKKVDSSSLGFKSPRPRQRLCLWVDRGCTSKLLGPGFEASVQELKLSCHNPETRLDTLYYLIFTYNMVT